MEDQKTVRNEYEGEDEKGNNQIQESQVTVSVKRFDKDCVVRILEKSQLLPSQNNLSKDINLKQPDHSDLQPNDDDTKTLR